MDSGNSRSDACDRGGTGLRRCCLSVWVYQGEKIYKSREEKRREEEMKRTVWRNTWLLFLGSAAPSAPSFPFGFSFFPVIATCF